MNQGAMYIAGRPGGRGRGGGRRSGRARAAFPGGARVSAVYMDHTYHTSNAKANNRAKQQALPPPAQQQQQQQQQQPQQPAEDRRRQAGQLLEALQDQMAPAAFQ